MFRFLLSESLLRANRQYVNQLVTRNRDNIKFNDGLQSEFENLDIFSILPIIPVFFQMPLVLPSFPKQGT
jgi:hypothetical protein